MTTVNSVLGGIESEDLGFTLMHEHILIANPAMRQAFADWVDVDAVMDFAVAELVSARERGVRTVVDLTPINLGRDIQVIEEVARRAEVQIVAATGYYWTEEAWLVGWEVDQIVEKTIREITDGIAGTSIKAGIIKCATDHAGVTPINDKLLRVAARLHRNTGVPISTHTEVTNRSGLAQQEVFEEEGVDLRRVVIGHCGDSKDLDYLEAILARGSFIGMDRFGVEMLLPTESRVATVAELCRRGYADQMVLSHDACCHMDFFPDMNVLRQFAQLWNFRHIPDDILPALRKEGVSEEQIRSMTVDNPRRVFEQQGAY
jgi:phosphotriesterase-related protein